MLPLRSGMTPQKVDYKNKILTRLDYLNMDCLREPLIKGIMLSFVESAEDVKNIRGYIKKKYNRNVKIYSKIETKRGILNANKIVEVSDYVVLARGDLLVQLGEKKFPLYQDKFLTDMKEYSNKTIIGTELAETYSKGYFMSRAELTFLFSLARLGYNNLLLVRETTKLSNPVEVVNKVLELMECYSKEL